MISPTGIRGFSEENGSWKIIWMCGRRARSARPFRRSTRTGCPPPTRNRISPRVGVSARRTRRAVVVFPQPLSPTRPSVAPLAMSKLTPSTATTVPTWRRASPANQGWKRGKCFVRSRTSRSGSGTRQAPVRVEAISGKEPRL